MEKIENDYQDTLVDKVYGGRNSLRKHDSERKKQLFETVPTAIKRILEDKEKIEKGSKKPKNHIGNFSSYQIETTTLGNQVLSWTEESHVVWQRVGAECIRDKNDKTPSNCGQIAKEYLLSKETNGGFNLHTRVKMHQSQREFAFAGKKKHLLSSVSGPADHSAKKAKLALEEKVWSGEIDIGKNVVEKVIQKRGCDKTCGTIVVNTFTIYARKHALHTLCVKFFNKYKKFTRLNPDSYFENLSKEELVKRFQYIGETIDSSENLYDLRERLKAFERTRSLQLWHDGSCITNHGHILFSINVLYDCAVFHTSPKYEQKFNVKKDIQRLVETPELYLIGRCANNDEQLGYIETRVSSLKELKNGMNLSELDESCENIVLNYTMRVFMVMAQLLPLKQGTKGGGGGGG